MSDLKESECSPFGEVKHRIDQSSLHASCWSAGSLIWNHSENFNNKELEVLILGLIWRITIGFHQKKDLSHI